MTTTTATQQDRDYIATYLTAQQAAAREGCSASHVRLLCRTGRVPGAILIQYPAAINYWLVPAGWRYARRRPGRKRGNNGRKAAENG